MLTLHHVVQPIIKQHKKHWTDERPDLVTRKLLKMHSHQKKYSRHRSIEAWHVRNEWRMRRLSISPMLFSQVPAVSRYWHHPPPTRLQAITGHNLTQTSLVFAAMFYMGTDVSTLTLTENEERCWQFFQDDWLNLIFEHLEDVRDPDWLCICF